MPVRRNADPQSVQNVWDAVRYTVLQKQQIDFPRLVKYIQTMFHCDNQQAEVYIQHVIKDNLLVSVQKSPKGARNNINNNNNNINNSPGPDYFRIPSTENNAPLDDGYDWYCIECHLAGDVICCQMCHRVFHLDCVKGPLNNRADISDHSPNSLKGRTLDLTKLAQSVPIRLPSSTPRSTKSLSPSNISSVDSNSSTVNATNTNINNDITLVNDSKENNVDIYCSVCRMLHVEKVDLIEREELNYLLNFTLSRIKIWLPSNITDIMAPRVAHTWMTEQEINWRVRQLLYQTMDIPLMEMKLRTNQYKTLAEFHADVLTIQHNVAIYHGVNSQEFQASELMVTDSKYDLVEIKQCIDCYRHSNEKRNEFWFCIPCRPPHKLVWAKQKGYPYWPAKVIRRTSDGQYDVRFFGAKHLRALISKDSNLKPIETNLKVLDVQSLQKNVAFKKAIQELTEHQRLLNNPDEVKQILSQKIDIKQKTPKRPKQSTQTKQAKESTSSALDEDVYEFSDTLLKTMESEPTTSTEKKKRGRRKVATKKEKETEDTSTSTTSSTSSSTTITTVKTTPNVTLSLSPRVSLKRLKLSPELQTNTDSRQDLVSSSTENLPLEEQMDSSFETNSSFRARSVSGSNSNESQQLERVYSEAVENLRRQMEHLTDKDNMIRVALETMQLEIDRLQNSHTEHIRSMTESHNVFISEVKKKQWCFNCEQEAIYHCCWNTAYCSTQCQQQHWQAEHKKICRRRR